jgi:arylsulfatase
VGEPDIKGKLLAGHNAGAKTFKVHLDGYNQLPHLTGQQERGARKESFTSTTTVISSPCATRIGSLYLRNSEWPVPCRSGPSHSRSCACPSCLICAPTLTSGADITSNTYYGWLLSQGYAIVAAQSVVGNFLASFKDYPPSQRAQSFSIDQIVEKMQKSLEAARQ